MIFQSKVAETFRSGFGKYESLGVYNRIMFLVASLTRLYRNALPLLTSSKISNDNKILESKIAAKRLNHQSQLNAIERNCRVGTVAYSLRLNPSG